MLYVKPETKTSVVVVPVTTNPEESKPKLITEEPDPTFLIFNCGTYAVFDAVAVILHPASTDENDPVTLLFKPPRTEL